MVDKNKPSRAMAIVTKLRPGVADGRSPALVGMVSAFDKAEATARLRPGAVRRTFLISCRVGGAVGLKGASSMRRSELVALIESRKPSEAHTSTSTWIIGSYLTAADLVDLLSEPIDASHDFLSVARVGSDRAIFGSSGLKP